MALGSAGGLCYAQFESTENLLTTQLPIVSSRVPREFHNYKIGFVSDLHYGESFSSELLNRLLGELRGQSLDIIALGGDYIWIPFSARSRSVRLVRNPAFADLPYSTLPRAIVTELASAFKDTLEPPDGIVAILGNHDNHHNGHICSRILKDHGINTLVNQIQTVKRGTSQLRFIGLDDYQTGLPRMPRQNYSANAFDILLCHNPDYIIEWLHTHKDLPADLSLCGHTHGGQIRLPFIDKPLLCNVEDRRFVQGLLQLEDKFSYTSRGIGVVEIPLRVACPPEVCIITLKNPNLL